MNRQFQAKMIRGLLISPLFVIPFLVLLSGASYVYFSDEALSDFVLKLFIVLFAITVWSSLLISIYMVRFVMPPIVARISDALTIFHSDRTAYPKPKGEVSEPIHRADPVRLKMAGAVAECAGASRSLSEVTSNKRAA